MIRPMALSPQQAMLLDMTAARQKAEALLQQLLESKAQSERRLAEIRQPDVLKAVTGRSSLDNAILSTRRTIDTLERALDDVKKDLSEEDLAILEDLRPDGAR